MGLNFDNRIIKHHMLEGDFGLERENLRVDANGFLSHTKHPFEESPNISRDFCENQVEIITGVSDSAKKAVNELKKLHNSVVGKIINLKTGTEYLWPFSNPPYVKGEDDIPIARFEGELSEKSVYRQYLAKKYGKMKMLFSGIHCNYSFSENMLIEAFRESGYNSFQEYKNTLYLELAKKLTRYGWLIVYLTAASSVADKSFMDKETAGKYASARCSEIGYWNAFIPVLSYSSLEEYVRSIQNLIDDGRLISASELYYPIRLKPKGENTLESLKEKGINHIELRMLDVNPLSPVGIFEEDLSFIQLMILYLMSLDDGDFNKSQQTDAIINIRKSAEFDDEKILIKTNSGKTKNIKAAAIEFLENMENFYTQLTASDEIFNILKYQKNKLINPDSRYAVTVRNRFNDDYVKKGLELAKQYANQT